MTLASTGFQKSTFHFFPYLNELGRKFDLDVKWVEVNIVALFEQTW